MTDNAPTTDAAADVNNVHRLMAGAFAALRIFTGLVWISNALAKIFDVGNYDWGLLSFNLITLGAARGIATDASCPTGASSVRFSQPQSWPSASVSYLVSRLG